MTRVRVTLLLASATVRNRPQPSATVLNGPQPFAPVCNRLQPFATVCNRPSATVVGAKLPCLWEKSQKNVTFWTCQKLWSCRSAWQACMVLCDIPTCFKTRQKSFCVAGVILLLHFQRIGLHFFVASAALWTPPV